MEFLIYKNAIFNAVAAVRPTDAAGPPDARQGMAMTTTNTADDGGAMLTLQDALCMVSFGG